MFAATSFADRSSYLSTLQAKVARLEHAVTISDPSNSSGLRLLSPRLTDDGIQYGTQRNDRSSYSSGHPCEENADLDQCIADASSLREEGTDSDIDLVNPLSIGAVAKYMSPSKGLKCKPVASKFVMYSIAEQPQLTLGHHRTGLFTDEC